jgi:hypothetical protein
MSVTNMVLIGVGFFVIIIGIVAFLNPNFARLINAPGSPRLKAIIALIVGVIIILIGLITQLPG